jgi:parvulin-like peptidyl-prolyl isomerase
LRRKGGYLGMVNRKEMKPEVSAKIFACTPPQVLKPIVTSKGVHLIRVEEIIQPELNNMLRYQILSDLFAEWLKKQVDSVEVMTRFNLVNQVA